ncbi:putative methyltransferase YGR283C [Candida parapsilosis]|nr:putative methyltransferase YGR283C [Candida parapsilosis]
MAKRKAESATSEAKSTKKPTRQQTAPSISICVPSSVISSKNAYNLQQKTMIAYQIAKASLIYDVAEIIVLTESTTKQEGKGGQSEEEKKDISSSIGKKVVFDDNGENDIGSSAPVENPTDTELDENTDERVNDDKDDALLLASLLQFFITPPYLIKTMFSPRLNPKFGQVLPKFKYAFKLPKIPSLPFMQNNNVHEHFKEGIIIPRETPKIKSKTDKQKLVPSPNKVTVSKYVNIGESEAMKLDIAREVPVYSRVTIDVRNKTIVSAKQAYGINGHKSSFGYHVRMVNDNQFNKVFTNSPLSDGYSQTIFVNCDDYFDKWSKLVDESVPLFEKKGDANGNNDNLLIILGNYGTIQRNFQSDEAKSSIFEGLDNVSKLFDCRLDIPKGCRIEDATLIALTKLLQ